MRPTLRLVPLFGLLISLIAVADERVVSSLGRLEPENGVVQLAGPSGNGLTGAVIKSLDVAEGDWVDSGQVVARLDSHALRAAEVARLEAILANARREMARWGDENRRDKRASHDYTLEEFGYTEERILGAFSEYRRRFIEGRAESVRAT